MPVKHLADTMEIKMQNNSKLTEDNYYDSHVMHKLKFIKWIKLKMIIEYDQSATKSRIAIKIN